MRAPTPSPTLFASLTDDVVASGTDTIPVPTPSTGEVLHDLPRSSADDVRDAVARARLAQLAWARAGFAERRARPAARPRPAAQPRRLLLDLVQLESGKTRGQAFEELYQAASVTRYNALSAQRVLRGRRRRAGVPLASTTRVRYRAKGVVGVITPWNYALSLAAMDVIPALAAGCAVVQKADDQGALTILALRRAFIDAGVPEALWAVVAGPAPEVGEALTDQVDYICFTGSTATGRRIAEKAGRRLVGASLELGGKNAMIVLDDVDPEQAAADAAYACFSAMGQLCVSIERIYVQRKVAGPFTARPRRAAAVGRRSDPRSTTPPTSARSRAPPSSSASRATSTTPSRRARPCSSAAKPRPDLGPWFFEPTVLTGVTPRDARLRRGDLRRRRVALPRRQRGGGDPRRERERVRAERVGAHALSPTRPRASPTRSRPAASTSTRATAARSGRSTPPWAA